MGVVVLVAPWCLRYEVYLRSEVEELVEVWDIHVDDVIESLIIIAREESIGCKFVPESRKKVYYPAKILAQS